MTFVRIPTGYYRQYDADLTRDVPGEAFAGWAKAELDFDLARSALVVMHAADCGKPEQAPGRYRSVEYLYRSNAIAENVFPDLLQIVRGAGLRVFHLPFPGSYYQHLPGYAETLKLATQASAQLERPPAKLSKSDAADSVRNRLKRFKRDYVFPGRHNAEANASAPPFRFYTQAEPLPHEPIAENEVQLLALCEHYGVEHLVYTGFAIDGCLLTVSGGMLDMSRHGILCSTIREAVTAIETKETARTEAAKAIALWRVAIVFGFVYELDDFLGALRSVRMNA